MSTSQHHASSSSHSSSNSNIIGVHFRVGRKIGEGSFGVIFEGRSSSPRPCYFWLPTPPSGCADPSSPRIGQNLLNSQTVAIKFVSLSTRDPSSERAQDLVTHNCERQAAELTCPPNRTRRNRARATPRNSAMSTGHTRSWPVRVRVPPPPLSSRFPPRGGSDSVPD